jgi:hypothetical protein
MERSNGTYRTPGLLHIAILVGLYSLPAAIGLRAIVDLDIWWHLRQGEWILTQKTLPLTDPFTSYGVGKSWIAYSWLYEIFVYALYRVFGLFGIVLYTTLLAFAITLALHGLLRRQTGDLVVASGLAALAVGSMFPVLAQPRPWLFNVLFLILELTVLLEVRRSDRTRLLWALVPLFLVWACINVQFVYGLFVVGLAVAETLLQRWPPLSHTGGGFRTRPMLATLAGCAIATCLTPYHVKIYLPVITAMRLTDPFLFLAELQAPPFRLIFDWLALGLLLVAAFTLGRQRATSPFLILLLITAASLAFRARRDVWFLVVVSVIIIATARIRSTVAPTVLTAPQRVAVVVIVLAVSVSLGVSRASASRLDHAVAESFPANAAAFVERKGYRGTLYNHYDWGGYLMWRLPNLDVSLDGRNPVHGDARIWQSIRTWGGRPGWASDPELAAAHVVIADVNSPLASLLRTDARFALVYEDRVAAVFINQRSLPVLPLEKRGA